MAAAIPRPELRTFANVGTNGSGRSPEPQGGIADLADCFVPSANALSSPARENILLPFFPKSPAYLRYPVPTKRGVSRSSRTLGGDAVDADALLTNSA